MKKFVYKFLKSTGFVFITALMLISCDKWIDTDKNINPDAPADVPMNLMMPAIQQAMGYNLSGNDLVRTTNIWMQQFDGVDRQSYTEARYQLTPADDNNIWNAAYTSLFMNSSILISKAENTEGKYSPYNAGIGRVMLATSLGVMTDLFGDMPVREALRGNQNVLKPKFDTQQKIYDTLKVILDKAIVDLGKASAENLVAVKGDVIYAGDVAKWKRAAFSIKARNAIQLSRVNTTSAYNDALTAAASGFTSISDDMRVPWESANHNPIFQFMEQRGDVRMGATMVDMMKATSDPRLPFYVAKDASGNYTGCVIGTQNGNASSPGAYIAGATASSMIMSYAELKFIVAEASFMTSKLTEAKAALLDAVKASVTRVTGSSTFDQVWYDTNIGSKTLTLELIMQQKYLATFGTNQAYADYRRVGLPVIPIHPGGVLPAIPTRYPYPQDEISYNGANVPNVAISDKLWWDK
jgi:hypothetical protein